MAVCLHAAGYSLEPRFGIDSRQMVGYSGTMLVGVTQPLQLIGRFLEPAVSGRAGSDRETSSRVPHAGQNAAPPGAAPQFVQNRAMLLSGPASEPGSDLHGQRFLGFIKITSLTHAHRSIHIPFAEHQRRLPQ